MALQLSSCGKYYIDPSQSRSLGIQRISTSCGMFGTRPVSRLRSAPVSPVVEVEDKIPDEPELSLPCPRYSLGHYDRGTLPRVHDPRAIIAGRAVQFDTLSRPNHEGWQYIFRPGCFRDALGSVPLLLAHDGEYEIDDAVSLSVDRDGLVVTSQNAHRHNQVLFRSVADLMRRGELNRLSIGMPPLRECGHIDYDEAGVRSFHHVPYLTEVSLCSDPQMPGTIARLTTSRFDHLRPLSSYHDQVLRAVRPL